MDSQSSLVIIVRQFLYSYPYALLKSIYEYVQVTNKQDRLPVYPNSTLIFIQ